MPIPTPTVIGSPIVLDNPPVDGQVPLACALVSGATYSWQLIERPEGSTATLTNATTRTPTLINVNLRGTYIVFLRVENSEGSSHPQPYPTQATTAPYGFSTPATTAFAVVRVRETSGLVKPGRGEYGWFEAGLWPLIDKVNDGLAFSRYDDPTRTLTANAIVPDLTVTPNDRIVDVAGLKIRNDVTFSEHEIYNAYNKINLLSDIVVTNKNVSILGGEFKADTLADVSGGNLTVTANADLVLNGNSLVALNSAQDISVDATTSISVEAGTAMDVTAAEFSMLTLDNLQLRSGEGTLSLTADSVGGNITLDAGSQLNLNSADITLQASDDIIVRTTGADADISVVTQGTNSSITLTTASGGATADIVANAGRMFRAVAGTEIELNAANRLYAVSKQFDIELTEEPMYLETPGFTADCTGPISLYADGNHVILTGPDTVCTKPVRAPGLVICDTVFDKEDGLYGPGVLFRSNVPVYTRYEPGSDLDVNITVAANAAKDATINLVLTRTVGSTPTTLATISSGMLSTSGWCLFSIRCRTKIVKDGLTVTHLEYDVTPPTAIGTATTPGSVTKTYTLRSEAPTGQMVFQVTTNTTLALYAAQMTCTLYNPHTQDVI